jgi:hypothetical protein
VPLAAFPSEVELVDLCLPESPPPSLLVPKGVLDFAPQPLKPLPELSGAGAGAAAALLFPQPLNAAGCVLWVKGWGLLKFEVDS